MNLIGQQIGSYIVERELGSGGTGAVYACRNVLIDREVAVKVLHDENARDPDQVARFFQEAKAAAEIGHPNIIVIIDYGTIETPTGPRTYLMMESLGGESLDKRMRRGGMTLDDIAHVLAQITSALVACHSKGVIHRDLKPSNIYLCNRSFDPLFVKVLDFGTAKLAAPVPGMHRTQYGVVIGTPAYMSPEQCDGKGAIDHRSDIYSLGVMLYEMLTGTLPYGGDLGEILLGHLTKTPDRPSQRNPGVPPEWEALCMRMMEKAREARFQSMAEVAHALDDLRGHASAYEAFRSERERAGHSGHTLVAAGIDAGDSASRMTMHADLLPPVTPPAFTPPPVTRPPVTPPAFVPPPVTPPPVPLPVRPVAHAVDPGEACASLVKDPRHVAFARSLMIRAPGQWLPVGELARASAVALPGVVVLDLVVSWLPHPTDANAAVVVFLSPSTMWRMITIGVRVRY